MLYALLKPWLHLFVLALRVFLAFCTVLLSSAIRAVLRNWKLKPIDKDALDLPLLAARLADLPYQVESADQVARSIATLLWDSTLLHFADQELMMTNSVWFMCEGRRSPNAPIATFLVFRGTMSPTDAIADVMFRPETGPNGVQCHGGFLRTIREDSTLHAKLAKHVTASTTELFVLGHSLGGALSQTLTGAGFLPPAFSGRLTVVSLGGPVVFFREPSVTAFDPPTAAARVISIVNSNDIVPRLLGCPLSFSRTVLSLFATSMSPRKQQEQQGILDTLEQYRGFPGYELVFLHAGKAYKVARCDRELVLHLAEAIHPRCVADHLAYVGAAEAAAGAREHWVAAS